MRNTQKIEEWITLYRVSGVGPKTFQKLLATFGEPSAVLNATTHQLTQAGFAQKLADSIQKSQALNTAAVDLEWLNESDQHHIISINCSEYPRLLKQINDAPPLLYVHGNLSLLNDPQLAIVGSRNPSQSGISSAYEFAKHLGANGLCITSGLALGIDGMAHQGALDAKGPTIAVIATGIDRVYPAKHRELAHHIVNTGAIISELPIGTQPKAENFPRRNRIISGLSYGTLVVEAALRSGSLITARLASEQNREVFAIPGSIHNPLAKGCHQLIRQGAKLVETAQDILEEMAHVIDLNHITATPNTTSLPLEEGKVPVLTDEDNEETQPIDDENQYLLEKMGYDPVSIDQLVTRTHFSPEALSTMLLMLELTNKVSANGGGTYTRLK